jgi:lanosterol synthase
MSHANGTSNGATKRNASQKILNDAAGVTKNKGGDEKTDYTRWRLKDDRGCQTWHYLQSDKEIKAWPQSTADKYFLGLDTVSLRLF